MTTTTTNRQSHHRANSERVSPSPSGLEWPLIGSDEFSQSVRLGIGAEGSNERERGRRHSFELRHRQGRAHQKSVTAVFASYQAITIVEGGREGGGRSWEFSEVDLHPWIFRQSINVNILQ